MKKYKWGFQLYPVYFLPKNLRLCGDYFVVIFLCFYLCYLYEAIFFENESYGIQAILEKC